MRLRRANRRRGRDQPPGCSRRAVINWKFRFPTEPLPINADPTRIEQVISNLLNNAAKFTDEGGRIAIIVERRDSEVICRIRDTGIGIASDMLSSIFNLFTQVARAQSIQGSLGIGLTLVRRLIEAHGGTVVASSKGLGHGSEFVIRLPLLKESVKKTEHQP